MAKNIRKVVVRLGLENVDGYIDRDGEGFLKNILEDEEGVKNKGKSLALKREAKKRIEIVYEDDKISEKAPEMTTFNSKEGKKAQDDIIVVNETNRDFKEAIKAN